MAGVNPQVLRAYLGPGADRGGPFGVLGVAPETCRKDVIEAALERQLDRIAQHPLGDSAESDQVRLAVHRAAEDLLSPVRRASWLAEIGAEVGPGGVAALGVGGVGAKLSDEGARGKPAGVDRERQWAREEGAEHGAFPWLRTAAAIGVALVVVIVGMVLVPLVSGGRRGGTGAGTAAGRVGQPGSVPAGGAGAAALESGAAGEPTERAEGAEEAEEAELEDPTTGAVTHAEAEDDGRAGREGGMVDPGVLMHRLGKAVERARRSPEAGVEEFVHLVPRLSAEWTRMDEPARRSMAAQVLELLVVSAGVNEAGLRALEGVIAPLRVLSAGGGRGELGAEDVLPAAWSAAMLSRLERSSELPGRWQAQVREGLRGVLGVEGGARGVGSVGAFEPAALAALSLMPVRLAGVSGAAGEDGWAAWLKGVRAAAKGDEGVVEGAIAGAVESIMAGAAEPEASQGVYGSITGLVKQARWRSGSPARARLLAWFRDERVSASDLHVVTGALAHGSSAEGVDATMVLSVGASVVERSQLRARYAEAWGLAEASSRAAAYAGWRARAVALMGELDQAPVDEAPGQQGVPVSPVRRPAGVLEQAVRLALVNEGAQAIWSGRTEQAEAPARRAQVSQFGPPVGIINAGTAGTADGVWAVRYLSAEQHIGKRLEALAGFDPSAGGDEPGGGNWVNGAVLAEAAYMGSPSAVREAAQEVVVKHGGRAAVVGGLLEGLPGAPRTGAVTRMIERVTGQDLPPPSDGAWRVLARRVLVERLLELLAAESPERVLNEIGRELTESYRRRGGADPGEGPTQGAGPGDAEEGVLAVRRVRVQVRRELESASVVVRPRAGGGGAGGGVTLTLSAIERRYQGRMRLADGPLQRLAAEQAGLAELLGYAVAAERPGVTGEVVKVLEELAGARRRARLVFEQLRAGERAMAELWMLRLGEGADPT